MDALTNVAAIDIEKDRLLIEAAQQDPSRFADLYENNFDRVYAFVVCRVRDRAEAEELTAEVFHRALSNLGRFEWRGVPFAAWLLRIAANILADRWQQAAKGSGIPMDLLEESGEEPGTEEHVERRAMLFQLVDRLPADQRTVILLRFVEQKSVREIAKQFRRSEGAIKQLQFRALQTLRDQLKESS